MPARAAIHADAVRSLVLHWGEMGTRWGVNRTVSQVHALLYWSDEPLDADQIAEALRVARSNVSTSLRELASWKLVRVVHRIGERKDRFETTRDPWELVRTIVRERKRREFDPTVEVLRQCLADASIEQTPASVQTRMRDTLHLMESVSKWSNEMAALPTPTLVRLLKLGGRIAKLIKPAPRP
ncbi:MAG TPA: MarR family transcriptional regulator [Casimicrobiaceae bacterium]|nr:MarR family transcriptional regulator [Casimicrobiaceae bacterium]